MIDHRLQRARALLRKKRLSGLLVLGIEETHMENVRFFSGFSGSDASLVISAKRALFFTDGRYIEQSKAEVTRLERVIYKDKIGAVAEAIKRLRVKRVGFEDEALPVALYNQLVERLPGIDLVPLAGDLDALRQIKSPQEIVAIRRAVRIAERALRRVIPLIAPGVPENRIGSELDAEMIRLGAQATAFDTIVASGPRGALPHGIASSRRIRRGELVTIDWGALVDQYNSDQTVTFAVGEIQPWQREIYQLVYRAQRAAIKACVPGAKLCEVDAVARGIIEQAGYGEYFTHGLGHGVGLKVHEGPRLSMRVNGKLALGNVVTVEPGVYLPNRGGVRLEDMVLVTDGAPRVLTGISKRLRVL
ncbi:MAG: Xaa-Pro peptidase family protein [Candidatus Alcyoniella australis]|nr:Xaa-Pro peptidase family protein [Candidatus Alcyoniella australis]